MSALALSMADLAETLSPKRDRFFVMRRTYDRTLSGLPRQVADIYDREKQCVWRCHDGEIAVLLSGEQEPDEDWLVAVDEDEEDV